MDQKGTRVRFLTAVLGFVLATLILTVLGIVFQTGFVLTMLSDVGAQIGFGAGASMVFDDLLGFGPIYGVLIAIGLLVALPVASIAHRVTKLPRALVFAGAGAVCMLVMLVAMEQAFFGVQLVAGARTLPGLMGQVLAGAIAGFAFTRLTPPPEARS